jgi:hypothetical protein
MQVNNTNSIQLNTKNSINDFDIGLHKLDFNVDLFNLVKENLEPFDKYSQLLFDFNTEIEALKSKKDKLIYDNKNPRLFYSETKKFSKSIDKTLRKITQLEYTFLIFKAYDYVLNRGEQLQITYLAKCCGTEFQMLRKIANHKTKLIHQEVIKIISKPALQLLCAYNFDAKSSVNKIPKDVLQKILICGFKNVDLMSFEKFEIALKDDLKLLFKES